MKKCGRAISIRIDKMLIKTFGFEKVVLGGVQRRI